MTTEVQIYTPKTMVEYQDLGKIIAQSKMFEDVVDENRAVVRIMAGAELGFPPVYSLTKIHMVKGKIALGYEAMARLIKSSGKYRYDVDEMSRERCQLTWYELVNGMNWARVLENDFSIEDAKQAGLVKDESGWTKYPREMLFSKALSHGARVVCPEVIGGAYTAEDFGFASQEFAEAVIEGSTTKSKDDDEAPEPPPVEKITDQEYNEARKWLGMTKAADVYSTLGVANKTEFSLKFKTKIEVLDALGEAIGKDWRNRCDLAPTQTKPPMTDGAFYCDECGQESAQRFRYGSDMICPECNGRHAKLGEQATFGGAQ